MIFGKRTQLLESIFLANLVALAACFPFNLRVGSLLTVALGCLWLFLGYYKNVAKLGKDKFFLLFTLFLVIPFISILYSEHKDLSILEKRSFLLVYPLIFFSSPISEKGVRMILHGFSVGCTLAAGYALTMTLKNGEILSTEMTTQYLGITHVYFGWYLAFSVLALGYSLLTKRKRNYISLAIVAQILFHLFFLFASGSKMAIIALFALSAFIGIRFVVAKRRWLLGAVVVIIPVLIFLITIRHFNVVYWRFYELFNPENYFVGDNAWNSIGVRLSILKCLFETIAKAPLFGTGIGDVQYALNECYESYELTSIIGMNAHNQYLQFLIGTGMVSLVCFILIFILSIKRAVREKNRVYLCFIFLFLLCSLTESILERQHGTMLFAFFNSLLFVNPIGKRPESYDRTS